MKIYRHPKYYYDLESITRFIDVEYVDSEEQCDYVAIASSHNEPVFEGVTKPILYSYIREHPYKHDQYLQTQFSSLKNTQDIKIFSVSSFDEIISNRENIIIDQFELDAYHRLFVKNECAVATDNIGNLHYLYLGGKANKTHRKFLYDFLTKQLPDKGTATLFDHSSSPDNAVYENNHYLGYPYDVKLYKHHNLSIIAETHFDQNQEFHPTEKTYRAIANSHPFIIASTPYFLTKLHNKGYQTFNKYWNENYDFTINDADRLQQLTDSIKYSIENIFYSNIKNICYHNLNTLKNNAVNTKQKIIKALK